MKPLFFCLLACVLAIPPFAQAEQTNAAPPSPAKATLVLPASAATVTAPLALANGIISQPERTELDEGGKAIFAFTITNAGDYLIKAVVDAPGEDANSFFLNIDAQPEDPLMIWDIDETSGFEERTVNWRGNGDPEPSTSQFKPKTFTLSAGEHKLIIVGREPMSLKTVSIEPAAK